MIRRILPFAAACALALSCGESETRVYSNNDLQLLTAYGAKEMCSCLFVMQQTDELCAAWTVASPNVKTVSIDRAAKRVETQAGLYWGARAHLVNDRDGCVIE
jgi:hypothetical protein